jgi:endogenous inhibitor of DNA gyrase (YacG/DUF329 family)
VSEKIYATWSFSLDTTCPHCKEDVDLTEADDFWEGKSGIEIPEHDTPRTTDMGVVCPACGKEFMVDCQY